MNGAKPSLSVVTAIRNGLELFRQTVPSILGQAFRDWEWIVIDDASDEPIGVYLRSFGDERIRYVRRDVPQGQTKCLNEGIRMARSERIVRMDGDDLAHPRRLEAIAAVDAPLVFSDYDVVSEDGQPVATVRYCDPLGAEFYAYFGRNNPLCHPTVAFRKHSPGGEVYQYDEGLKNAQDFALWKRIRADYGNRFAHIAEPLVQYRLVRQSLSGARAREQKHELRSIRSNSVPKADAALRSLNPSEQDGMYAYRMLYYRFVGQSAGSLGEDLQWLRMALKYPPVLLKSTFFWVMRPLRRGLKTLLFNGIYR